MLNIRLPRYGVIASMAAALCSAPASSQFPYGQPSPQDVYDYADYLYIGSGDCSEGNASVNGLHAEFDCENDWKFTDHRDMSDPLVFNNPQEWYGVKGAATNRAFEVSTGRPDVIVAIADSGIRWEESRPSIVNKYYLNRGELPMPRTADGDAGGNPRDRRFGGYDLNGDGVFNVQDYAEDSRVSDLNGNEMIDPEDLIRVFSDSRDDDNNGYVDDISGWDFFENDNNPQDDVDNNHGTKYSEASAGEAGLADTQCPNCMTLVMRVGDSFVADVNHYAEAVVYAVDNGAQVVLEALGTLNHTSFGQAAHDHAYRNGVIIMTSEADEAAAHHNWPAAYGHDMTVNAIRNRDQEAVVPNSYLYFSGCTNFGGYSYVSIPATSCSSEATGRSGGISGLLMSAALNAMEEGHMTPYIHDDGRPADFALSAEEAMQLWRLAADDIDFSSSCPGHAACDEHPDGLPVVAVPENRVMTHLVPSTRYQTVKGWDYFTGYGRANNGRLLRMIGRDGDATRVEGPVELSAQDRIPPEADIVDPGWWAPVAYRGQAEGSWELLQPQDPEAPDQVIIRGRVAANRVTALGGRFDWVLEFAPHVQGVGFAQGQQAAEGSEEGSSGPWFKIAGETGRQSALSGELGRVGVGTLITALEQANNPFNPLTDPTSPYLPERFAVRLRLRVQAHPINDADTINNEAVFQKQIDVYPADEQGGLREVVLRSNLGVGGANAGGAGSVSFQDLNGDGVDELLVPSSDGLVHAFTDLARGIELPGWPVRTRLYPGVRLRGDNAYTRGEVSADVPSSLLLGSVAVADLDDDGFREVIAADMEGYVYAWDHTGQIRPGFPVSVDFGLSREVPCGAETIPDCDDYEPGPAKRDKYNARDPAISSAPAIGDLDPNYPGLEIVAGAADSHVYAWHADGTPVPGWPVILRDPAKVGSMDPLTRFYERAEGSGTEVGSKIIVTPSLGDLDGDGDLEVVVPVNEEYEEAPNVSLLSDPLFTVLGQLSPPGNGRVYALHHDGDLHPVSAEKAATPHTQDQAYLDGWPVPLHLAALNLLPYVGIGADAQAVLADVDGDGDLEIATSTAIGAGYLLGHDGQSHYGQGPDGHAMTLASSPAQFGPLSLAQDGSTLVALGGMAFGSLDGGQSLSLVGPGVGLKRLLDVTLVADQALAEDHMLIWDAATGQFAPNAPVIVNDLQFFVQPSVADIDGDGLAEAITSTAVSDLVAIGQGELDHQAQRVFTGGWTVTAAAVGSMGGPHLQLATITREGHLRLIDLPVPVDGQADCRALREWPEYGHDAHNSGNYQHDAQPPSPPGAVRLLGLEQGQPRVEFTLSGDDRMCGQATRLELRVGDAGWHAATPLMSRSIEQAPGSLVSLNLSDVQPLPEGSLMLRIYDEAGNGSALSTVEIASARQAPLTTRGGVLSLLWLSVLLFAFRRRGFA